MPFIKIKVSHVKVLYMYKLALVKEACYQDLWVCDKSDGYKKLLESSLLRVGPVGLLEIFNGDFYILETNKSKVAQELRSSQIYNLTEKDYEQIENTIPELSNKSPREIARNPGSIYWNDYDIVISINFAVPIKIRKKYKNVVWICLTGEGKFPVGLNSWDYLISHNCPSSPFLDRAIIDMPYTFISSDFLIKNFNKDIEKSGIYFEVNSFNQHWPSSRNEESIPAEFKKLGIPLRFHNGDTKSHLDHLIFAKYFIKYQGRPLRGNSFIEAISSECICFLSYSDCFGKLNLPRFCYYSDIEELMKKIDILENDNNKRLDLILEQKTVLDSIISNVDLQFKQAIEEKRNNKRKNMATLKEKFFKLFSYLYYSLIVRIKIPGIDKIDFLPPMHE